MRPDGVLSGWRSGSLRNSNGTPAATVRSRSRLDIGRAGFVRCLSNGCVDEVVMDDNLLKQLHAGQTATFIIFQTPEEGIGFPISLKSFGESYDNTTVRRCPLGEAAPFQLNRPPSSVPTAGLRLSGGLRIPDWHRAKPVRPLAQPATVLGVFSSQAGYICNYFSGLACSWPSEKSCRCGACGCVPPASPRTNARVISRLRLHTRDWDCARRPRQVRRFVWR
jgi:hypothetical protein